MQGCERICRQQQHQEEERDACQPWGQGVGWCPRLCSAGDEGTVWGSSSRGLLERLTKVSQEELQVRDWDLATARSLQHQQWSLLAAA